MATEGELKVSTSKQDNNHSIYITKNSDATLNEGFNKRPLILVRRATNPEDQTSDDGILAGDEYIYKQTYSTIYTRNYLAASTSDEKFTRGGSFRVNEIVGETTKQIPTEGNATYTGEAFNADNKGKFEYSINFTNRTGSGRIYQLANNLPDIQLNEGQITAGQLISRSSESIISSQASINNEVAGKYTVGLFGSNAENIAGEVYLDKELPHAVRTNGGTQHRYEGQVRGVVFAVAGTKQ
ncbi:factor H binding protein domain-containing protein [Gallibacterium trehalosifermentans]|uniref:Factor H binding protein domain-containing protein n=1 Tax=Gallibacterium trehalosifermentans TaxID=516935 RepID=A0ABV6H1R9_9PAST